MPRATARPCVISRAGRRGRGLQGRRLEGVADGVPVVEDPPQAGLALIGRDDRGLDGHVAGDDRLPGRPRRGPGWRRPAARRRRRGPASRMTPCLTTSARPVRNSSSGSVASVSTSASTARRLVERPDEVLALRMVDGRLAADAGVDLGQQGCRDGHPRECRACRWRPRSPARSVTTPPPRATTTEPRSRPAAEQGIVQPAGLREGLGGFARLKDDGLDVEAGGAQRLRRPAPGSGPRRFDR